MYCYGIKLSTSNNQLHIKHNKKEIQVHTYTWSISQQRTKSKSTHINMYTLLFRPENWILISSSRASCEGNFNLMYWMCRVWKMFLVFVLMRSNSLGFHKGIVFSTEFTFQCWLSINCRITLWSFCKKSMSFLRCNFVSVTKLWKLWFNSPTAFICLSY